MKLAQPLLDEIRDTVNETVILGARIQHRVLIISVAEAFDSLKISVPVGSTIPLIAGAVGKAFLATENPELVATMIQKYGLRTYTPRSITDVTSYFEELDRVRTCGHAVDIEEYLPGINAVAVALQNLQGLPIAIWVVGMSANIDADKLSRIATITKEQAQRLRRMVDKATFR
ncbi:hypothetical protein DSCO28_64910 [Desulfosarcina ovata subsp. sediminis]|uniref:IclR-ED domain-containing protein n=3 Tax=Desulfosarcina ovata TaxID=83564 RepID=A0A5K8AJN9_9BACT|nr:hypothetical protein DSCO28_64910 [Desulfosarcina ovata subsp. sediminis]BBO92912.1 hypothetical protein DSCOOX_60920 [Desulfosarcina ovata subsp. ovata]